MPRPRFKIREWRQRLNLSQTLLAVRANVARSNLSRIERGIQTPQTATVERLCDALSQEETRQGRRRMSVERLRRGPDGEEE